METLSAFFAEHPKVGIAFSGGVDSAYLLACASACGADVHAYYVQSAFQPIFEREDAQRIAKQLKVQLTVLNADVLHRAEIVQNDAKRCYRCKQYMMSLILDAAKADGIATVLDGTNASDEIENRPGMRALTELGILSPLRECGLTKSEIRQKSRDAGLAIWDKPAYACLATRIPIGTPICEADLQKTENAENFLFSLGFRDFRVRLSNGAAKIQVTEDQLDRLMLCRQRICLKLRSDYSAVLLDLEGRA